jgi:hypothetical protein
VDSKCLDFEFNPKFRLYLDDWSPRASPLRSVIAPRNTFPLCQVHIFSTSLSLSIFKAAQHFFIIAVATVHQRLFTTLRTTTRWNQSTGRTAWNQSTQARPLEPLIFGRGLLLHTNPVSSSARPQSGEKGAVVAIGELPKFYVEFNCLDHEEIAQSFKFDARLADRRIFQTGGDPRRLRKWRLYKTAHLPIPATLALGPNPNFSLPPHGHVATTEFEKQISWG